MTAQDKLKKYKALRAQYLARTPVPRTAKDKAELSAAMHAMDMVLDDLIFRARSESLVSVPLCTVKEAYWERLRRAKEIARVNMHALSLMRPKSRLSFVGLLGELRP